MLTVLLLLETVEFKVDIMVEFRIDSDPSNPKDD